MIKTFGIFLLTAMILNLSCHEAGKRIVIQNSKILFLSNRDAPERFFDIFMMNGDGSGQTNLTKDWLTIRTTSNPKFSPDQKKILFYSLRDNRNLLQVMESAGSHPADSVEVNSFDPKAKFSADGSMIVYVSMVDRVRQIFVYDCDNKVSRNLSQNQFHEYDPMFSPDGAQIVYVSERSGVPSIFIMNVDGSKQTRLTDSGEDHTPAFSADGSKIVFGSKRNGLYDIYMMKKNGKKLQNLTQNSIMESEPMFYPDGSRVLFLSNQRGAKFRDICTIDIKSRVVKNLTKDLDFANHHPCFSPDGKQIVFASIRARDCEIFSMDSDGKNIKNLSNNEFWDQAPSF